MPKAHSSPRIPSGPAGNGWDTNLVLPFASLCPCSLASLSSSAVRTLEVLLFSNEKMQRMNFSRNFQISRLSMQKIGQLPSLLFPSTWLLPGSWSRWEALKELFHAYVNQMNLHETRDF